MTQIKQKQERKKLIYTWEKREQPKTPQTQRVWFGLMVLTATFNNILVISWRSVYWWR
jgi:hypothetical protein